MQFAFCIKQMFTFVNRNRSENRFLLEDTAMENTEMKDRIAHIIRAKNLTAAEFAFRIGIQPSNVSHLLSGRNNPSLDFVKKLKETFPEYNLDWLVMGRGPITVSEPLVEPIPSVEHSPIVEPQEKPSDSMAEDSLFEPTQDVVSNVPTAMSQKSELKQIIFVYSDHTFESILPR